MNRIVALDVETPNRLNNRVCSIALTVLTGGEIETCYSSLVNPEVEFDTMNIRIHGIKPQDVFDAPTFPYIWNEIREIIHPSLLVAHNAVFDLNVLRKTLLAYEINEPMVNYVCTLEMARDLIDGLENYKLSTLSKYVGWELHHHDASSDSRCCAELVRSFLGTGVSLDGYIRSFDLSVANGESERGHRKKEFSNQSKALKELKGLLTDIVCDDVLSPQEVLQVQHWLEHNKHMVGHFPYDKITEVIENVLMDGILERCELQLLLSLFTKISDPVNSVSCGNDSIGIADKNIVLTGEFDRGDRRTIENELTCLGAICQNGINKKTNYLIVGGQGSSSWFAGNYGKKVKRALELQEKGLSIQIIREADFYKLLKEGS